MYYQLTGNLKQLAFEHLEDYQRWNDSVMSAIAQFGAKGYYRFGHPMTGYWVGALSFSDGKPPEGWRFDGTNTCYVPDRRTKAGKLAHHTLGLLGKEPCPIKLFEAIGVEIPLEIGNRFVIPGLGVSAQHDYAVLHWGEDLPLLEHPEAIEITVTQFKALKQEAVTA